MTIEKNAYLTTLNNKIVYDKTFKVVESNGRYARFFNQGDIQVNGRAVEYLLTWPKEGIDWENDLSIYKTGNEFKRKINVVPILLPKQLDKVYYEVTNEERFEETLESEVATKEFTNKLLEQTADKVNIDLETIVPGLICNDENFIKYDETSKKGNLYEEDKAIFWRPD